jgi:hypothetical protein
MSDEYKVYGVKADGTEVLLGTVKGVPPEVKRKEIVANYFWEPRGDEDEEAHACLWALEDYHEWLVEQGWKGPVLRVESPDELDDDHPLACLNDQIIGLMEGIGASEDHEDVIAFLLGTGLPRSTVDRIHRAIVHAEVQRMEAGG